MLSSQLPVIKLVQSRGVLGVLLLVSPVSGEEVHIDLDRLPLEMYPKP